MVDMSMKKDVLDFKADEERMCILRGKKTKFHNLSLVKV